MNAEVKELKRQIAEVERRVECAEQAGHELKEEHIERIGALVVEIARQHVRTRQVKLDPVLDGAVRGGKLFPAQRSSFESHLMAVPFEKFDAELEKVRLSFEEAPQVIELGVEHGDGIEFAGPGSGEDPVTREELGDELKSAIRAQAKVIDSSGIRESIAAEEAQESEEVK